ncbi:MAG: lipoprotein ABC transporter ATP-binding protein [gamma proteobacterium symbiont of Ctena orbiculata]|nr:MAG: lipoprotein ABC transporter ATP-binding protein [gamma proteobacterium symbiont of Ctena orbiculata]PVV18824.1 MAG: lipoprotein ABC transporter ATP-binding protein [gamma proteobacterium symbiont of Ctena orbiculata]PVV23888.1 MAG: lipoprotein ABC transporter ATP-binding protein [gamma proteobacterium symbiont of Ctena orbiculata]
MPKLQDPSIISIRNLHKCYWVGTMPFPALHGIDLDIQPGEFAVVAGRSGSGKSTLLNIIGALESADNGKIEVLGQDILNMNRDQRTQFRLRNIGFVFQAYNLIRVFTARENVAYVCQLQGKSRKESLDIANHWLHEVEIGHLGYRRPDQLSGGQQQRVAVARALASEPKLILADEPTANLDSMTGRHLIHLMHELNQRLGTTFLISSHDPDVKQAAGRLIKLADGQIVASWDEIPKPPQSLTSSCPVNHLPLKERLRNYIKSRKTRRSLKKSSNTRRNS